METTQESIGETEETEETTLESTEETEETEEVGPGVSDKPTKAPESTKHTDEEQGPGSSGPGGAAAEPSGSHPTKAPETEKPGSGSSLAPNLIPAATALTQEARTTARARLKAVRTRAAQASKAGSGI